MKYEVIGWTHVGNGMYPAHEHITASVDKAIVKEIREHKYLFGGDAHERYCPVLNDGTYVSYSWRGWGGVMALAYDLEGDHAYMHAYMNNMIKPKARKYPEDIPDDNRIVPKESLTETFVMHLADDMFEKVKAGTKTIEMRLFDDKRKLVDVGDYIEFVKLSDENERVIRRVADLNIWESFKDAFKRVYYDKKKRIEGLRFTPEQLGAPENSDLKSLVDGMYKYYSKAQEKEHGVIAFTLEKPKHSCSIRLNIMWYSPESLGLRDDKMMEFDYDMTNEEYIRVNDAFYDHDSLEKALSEIAEGFLRREQSFVFGDYDEYDVDVNVMLRKMLKDLFGKEQKLKDITEKFLKVITLEIFAVIVKDSEQPNQLLSLDKDIIEFLHKSGVELKLGTKII